VLYDVAPIEGFEPQAGLLLASLADSTREWREELGEPPVEAIVWQPWPGGYSIGGILLHLINVEAGWFERFLAGQERDPDELKLLLSEETDVDACKWPAPPPEPIEWYLALHDRVRERAWAAIKPLTEPERVYKGRQNEMTLRWVLAHVLEHDSYHGGQAVLLHEMWKQIQPA
jgi:uncharacterized damage-inducible protein DinB